MSELLRRVLDDPAGLSIVDDPALHGVGAWSRPAAPGELPEWQAVLDAVEGAKDRLTMLELGAGYGRWTVIAAAVLRRYRPELRYRFLAVEAEPTHYRWLQRYTRANGLPRWSRRGTCQLVEAAVSREAGRERFYVGKASEWYGQQLARDRQLDEPTRRVRTIRLGSVLARLDRVDLIDLDVQGAELEVLSEAAPWLGRVRRVHVETHTPEIDERLPGVFQRAPGEWRAAYAVRFGGRCVNSLGEVDLVDAGVQVWRNDAAPIR